MSLRRALFLCYFIFPFTQPPFLIFCCILLSHLHILAAEPGDKMQSNSVARRRCRQTRQKWTGTQHLPVYSVLSLGHAAKSDFFVNGSTFTFSVREMEKDSLYPESTSKSDKTMWGRKNQLPMIFLLLSGQFSLLLLRREFLSIHLM